MPLPQVNERIKEVPAQALRAVFAGIGQVLLVADKIRNRAVEQVSATVAATAPPREAPPADPATAPSVTSSKRDDTRWRSLDKTGNVTLVSEGDEAAEAAASAPPAPDVAAPGVKTLPADGAPADGTPADGTPADGTPADGTPADGTPADGTAADGTPADQLPEVTETPATPTTAEVPAAEPSPAAPQASEPGTLPLSNYDALSIPSLRARLRVLNASQIAALLEYEKVTEGRPEVINMFERRLAKLAQEDG